LNNVTCSGSDITAITTTGLYVTEVRNQAAPIICYAIVLPTKLEKDHSFREAETAKGEVRTCDPCRRLEKR